VSPVGIRHGERDLSASGEFGREGAYKAHAGATCHAARATANKFVYVWGKIVA
jgi:hypothetical protein